MTFSNGGSTPFLLTEDEEMRLSNLVLLTISILQLSGCPGLAPGYVTRITAHITEEQALEFRDSRDLKSLPGVRRIRGEKSPCAEYASHVPSIRIELSVRECAGASKDSLTGWGYWVDVMVYEGDRADVRSGIEEFVNELETRIKEKVGDVKITRRDQRFMIP